MFILIKSFFWMCWMDFDYSHERTEVRRDYCFSVDTCHCALLIYRNYTGPWISLWETRNCPGIFPTTSSFIESFLQRRQSWRHLSYYITNMPFSQPHHTSMMNLPRNLKLYSITWHRKSWQKNASSCTSEESKHQVKEKQGSPKKPLATQLTWFGKCERETSSRTFQSSGLHGGNWEDISMWLTA